MTNNSKRTKERGSLFEPIIDIICTMAFVGMMICGLGLDSSTESAAIGLGICVAVMLIGSLIIKLKEECN